MMKMIDCPQNLKNAEFAIVHFLLEFQEPYHLRADALLRLRRDLRGAAQADLRSQDDIESSYEALFNPPLTSDPVALKRYQRPGPPFVILPAGKLPVSYEAGDMMELTVIFWGGSVRYLKEFALVLQSLGRLGFHKGEGTFELAAIQSEDAAGERSTLWSTGEGWEEITPTFCDARWWLETRGAAGSPIGMQFLTPARLLSRGKPLFKPCFARIFPFLLRRVTSMLYAHCGLEVAAEINHLLSSANKVVEKENNLFWKDWRSLEGDSHTQELGGVCGSVVLEGDSLFDILWVLNLGTLLNMGKGASFCAGHYLLKEI